MATKDERLLIKGDSGQLEIWPDIPADLAEPQPICVISHPHPLYGGSMTNKVVFTIAKAMLELGVATVRYNFRGVGRSEGSFAGGQGESEDLLSVVEWIRDSHPDNPLWLAGFSFGAFVTMNCVQRVSAQRMVLVAPPVGSPYFSNFQDSRLTLPWLVINGNQDELISPVAIDDWIEGMQDRPAHVVIDGADHFFNGKLTPLKTAILEFCRG